MVELFANSGDPDQMPHFAKYPFLGYQCSFVVAVFSLF